MTTESAASAPASPGSERASAPPPRHIVGLDSIRFALAFLVVLGHFGGGLGPGTFTEGPARWIRLLCNLTHNGPAAVIAFFVVSGLCIHYPNRHQRTIRILPFYVRREIRILIPLGLMLLLSRFIDVPMGSSTVDSMEPRLEIYHLCYPPCSSSPSGAWGSPR